MSEKQEEQGRLFENVTYAVGDPYCVFDHIPHTVLPNGDVLLSKQAILKMWQKNHKWVPLAGWDTARDWTS